MPVVGGFSAGKSTLINSFLGEAILPTAITPETALATELRYSENNYIEAINSENQIIRYEISAFLELKNNAQNFNYLRLYLNNEQLKNIQPLVLVDMPGFDAPIEHHNRAILNYLSKGVYFVFLNSVEDGTITLSIKRTIENLEQIGKGFAFCISKTNLRASSDVQKVQEQIAEQLEDYFDYTSPITLLDMNGGNNLKNILFAINPEKLFYSLFIDALRDNYLSLIQSINLKISTFKSSQKETEEALQQLHQAIHELSKQKEIALIQAEQRYAHHSVNRIVDRVAQSLINQKEQLINLAIKNPDALSKEVNELVKDSLLIEVQQSFQEISHDILVDFSHHLKNILNQNESIIFNPDMVGRIENGIKLLLNKGISGLNDFSKNIDEKSEKNREVMIYRTLSTILGITTKIINPILELVLIFLPDIINLFTRSSQEQKMRQQAEEQILGRLIPDIKREIRRILPEILNQQISALIAQISEQFEGQLQEKRQEIQLAEKEKLEKQAQIEQLIDQLENDKQSLNQLANKYLFS